METPGQESAVREKVSGRNPISWRPNRGPQAAFLRCPVPEILFGGARGGGKTDAVLGRLAIRAIRYGKAFNAIHFRIEMPQSDDVIMRSRAIFEPLGAKFRDHPHRQWVFPGGGVLRFRPLANEMAARKYQGQNLSDVAVEEAGNYADPAPIMMMHATLRAPGIPSSMILTANPGGAGHQWIRARYVSPYPKGFKVLRETYEYKGIKSVRSRVYIPSKVTDNPRLPLADYIGRLRESGSEALQRAWLEGDWDAILGQYFDEWRPEKHTCLRFPIPEHWVRFRSFDWGSARPFAVHWWAVASETHTPAGQPDLTIPKGAMYCYREWYGVKRTSTNEVVPNEGLKMTAEEVARGIRQRESGDEDVMYSVADPSIFATDGGPSIRERMAREGVRFRPADNKRVSNVGAVGGWDALRARLRGDGDGVPMIFFSRHCTEIIRTLPALQHDPKHPEDLDTTQEDHAADSVRYACMSRMHTRSLPAAPDTGMKDVMQDTMEGWFQAHERGNQKREY